VRVRGRLRVWVRVRVRLSHALVPGHLGVRVRVRGRLRGWVRVRVRLSHAPVPGHLQGGGGRTGPELTQGARRGRLLYFEAQESLWKQPLHSRLPLMDMGGGILGGPQFQAELPAEQEGMTSSRALQRGSSRVKVRVRVENDSQQGAPAA